MRAGQGTSPFGATAKPEYRISVVYICDAFFAVYQGAVLSLQKLELQLPVQGEEVYFRHVSAVNYNPPNVEVVLSNGKTMRKLDVGTDGGEKVLGALRAKLRGANLDSVGIKTGILQQGEIRTSSGAPQTADYIPPDQNGSRRELDNEERCCYLRHSRLTHLLSDPSVLDVLVEQLEVPGEPKNLKRLTSQEKMHCIETQIDHFRRTPTSV